MATEASTNANIQATTRELFLRTIAPQVFMKMPLYARLLLAKKINWEGGRYISRPVDKAEMDDLSQSYLAGERLTAARKTLLDTPYFHWKYNQTPVAYDVEEELQNSGGGDTAPVKLIKFLVKKAQRAARLFLYKRMYGMPLTGTTLTVGTDHSRHFQSVCQALEHDTTYGHLARATTTTNKWWQGASIAATYADQSTAYTPSIVTFRKAKSAIQEFVENPGNMLAVCGPAIFLDLQTQVEARHIYNRDGSALAKYGFNTMMIDGVEVVEDPFLKSTYLANGAKYFYMFNISEWELRLHPQRSFKFTGFKWQGDVADGFDEWLARILVTGNLVCWQPNASIWLKNCV